MIVVTVGTNEQPFERLVGAAAGLRPLRGELIVQFGSSARTSGYGSWVDFLPFDELERLMSEADAVVCHAGVGSILLAHRCGHRPVVVPRVAGNDEAVDDHQIPFAQRMADAGLVTLVMDTDELGDVVAGVERTERQTTVNSPLGAGPLAARVGADLEAIASA